MYLRAMLWRRLLGPLMPLAALIVALGLAGATAPASASAGASTDVSPFSSFGGTVKSPDGQPVAGDTVFVYPLDGTTRIGTATTNSHGHWSFTLPAALPADVQADAGGNGGWLNVLASAFGTDASGYETEADAPTFAWAGPGTPANTASLVRPPMIMTMGPAMAGEPSVTGAVIPDVVSKRLPKKCRSDGGDWRPRLITMWKGWAWTDVGEYHAWWEATGNYTYTKGAETDTSADWSLNGKNWHVDMGTLYDNEYASSDGLGGGPYNSHIIQITLKYRERDRYDYPCKSGTSTCWPKVHCANHYWVQERGLYNPGYGWIYIRSGPSVTSLDGMHGWRCCANPKYWNGYEPGVNHCNDRKQGVTYSKGATLSLGPVSVSIETETGNSTDSDQCIAFSHSTKKRYDQIRKKRSDLHEVWGNDAPVTNFPNVFYNY